ILYTSDGEQTGIMDLETLIKNFNENDVWHSFGGRRVACEEDILHELESRGWYDGLHEFGRYLILNLDKFDLKPVHDKDGLRPVKWSFDYPDRTFDGWTDDTTWNGFLNVCVDPFTRQEVVDAIRESAISEEEDSADEIAALPVIDGKVWLAGGWA